MNSIDEVSAWSETCFEVESNTADASALSAVMGSTNGLSDVSEPLTIDPALIGRQAIGRQANNLGELIPSADCEQLFQGTEDFKEVVRRQVAFDLYLSEQKRQAASMAERIAALNEQNRSRDDHVISPQAANADLCLDMPTSCENVQARIQTAWLGRSFLVKKEIEDSESGSKYGTATCSKQGDFDAEDDKFALSYC